MRFLRNGLMLLLALLFTAPLLAVSLEIQGGMTVQTFLGDPNTPPPAQGMGEIILDGTVIDLPMNASAGYLLGKVTCTRPDLAVNSTGTGFAGLQFPSFTGTMTRVTRRAYEDHTPLPNVVRWYRASNTGNAATGNMAFNFITSGTWNETNSVPADYVMLSYAGSSWSDPIGTPTATSPVNAVAQSVPAGQSDWIVVHHTDVAKVFAKVWLEGPYSTATHQMVRTSGYKAILDTLKRDWLTKFLTSDVSTPITTAVPNAMDFVLVYLRNAASGGSPAATALGVIGTNGFLYDLNGDPGVSMNIPNGDYYIVVLHHNHLAVQSATAVNTATLTGNVAGEYFDFTVLANCYQKPSGSNNEPVKMLESGVYGQFAGNAASSIGSETGAAMPIIVYSLDGVPIQQGSGDDPKYTRADTNLNGVVVYALDFVPVQMNSGLACEVPMPIVPVP